MCDAATNGVVRYTFNAVGNIEPQNKVDLARI